MTDKRYETIDRNDPVAKIAHSISDNALIMATQAGISRWDLCVALANACGHILADGGKPLPAGVQYPKGKSAKKMPREVALQRMDDLRTIMQAAYDMRDCEGSG